MTSLKEAAAARTGPIRYLALMTVKDYTNQQVGTPATDVELLFSNVPYQDRIIYSAYYRKQFEPRIETALNINLSMFDAGLSGGFIKPEGGTIRLANGDGALDYLLLNHSFDQQPFELRMLRSRDIADQVSDHPLVFKGFTKSIAATDDSIEIVVGDFLTKLDRTFPLNKFTSAGSPIGTPKPITLGKVFNIPAILEEESTNTYQVHDGAITSIDAVYVGGELQTLTTDYTVNTAKGLFSLTSAPTGVVTADVTNNVTKGSYTNGAGVILEELATTYGGLTDITEILTSKFRFAFTNEYEHGVYFDKETTVLEAMNELLVSIGGFIKPAGGGPLSIDIPEFPASTDPLEAETIGADEVLSLEVLPTQVFAGVDVNVRYKRNYRPLSESELGSSPDDREFATQEWRVETASVTNDQLDGNFSQLKEITVETTITNSTDAAAEATRLANFYNRDAKVYRLQLKLTPLYLEVGGTVNVYYPRYGLEAGRSFLILSKFEDLQANEITLEVMG